ncbi:DUF1441 family protein [Pseudomonas stutzeri]|uniref:DUF1441 family protein n=1 Tax=Stutzerimonas stutzeri TaxID=316 RepID=UPI00210A7397|nr:DUF1441 family protein [Stutzerimonas stutzeri]MCQ4311704.1 DUF1441 family protein [Stutzerimonas stutzeri]
MAPKEAPKKRGRPPKAKPPVAAEEIDDLIGDTDEPLDPVVTALADVYGGVSASWLAQVFGHDKNTIAKKLASAGCEVVGRRNGGPLYRIPDAAAYLVKPKVDLVSYIKTLRPNDLPPMLNDAYWGAMLKRQKFEENARDLWRTESVLKVFGNLAISFKTTANLWVEEVERIEGLTPEQRVLITQLTDRLLENVYQLMVEAPKNGNTLSSLMDDGAEPEDDGAEPEDAQGATD